MAANDVRHFRYRARDFLDGMNLMREDLSVYRSSAALLGIHSAISIGDALRSGLGAEKLSAQDHKTAANDLETRLKERRFSKLDGMSHYRFLLGKKDWIAYSRDYADEYTVQQILMHADRFALWAEKTGSELRIEGWIHD